MKRLLSSLFLMLVLVVMVVSCRATPDAEPEQDVVEPTEEVVDEAEVDEPEVEEPEDEAEMEDAATATAEPAPSGDESMAQNECPQQGGTLIFGLDDEPATLNVAAQSDNMGGVVSPNIFSQLVTLDENNIVSPDLAESWEVSDDGLTYTFQLHEGVTWHDGTPFTSADVKWTFDAILENEGPASGNLGVIESIEAPDDHTVVLNLSEPNSALLGFVGWFGTIILPQHIYEGTDWLTNPANRAPVGTGPFKFVEWSPGESISLEANNDYFRGVPCLDHFVYRIMPDSNVAAQALLSGELDYSNVNPPLTQIEELRNAGINVDIAPIPAIMYFQFNLREEPLSNPDVRRAIAMAINRTELVELSQKGYAFEGDNFYTPTIAWAVNEDATAPDYDPEAAEELLDAAGYPRNEDGTRFEVSLLHFSSGDKWTDLAQVANAQLEEIGIAVTLEGLEFAAWSERMGEKDFEISLLGGGWGPDPHNLALRVGSDGFLQHMGYNNPEVDELLEEGVRETDQAKRQEIYYRIQEKLAEDLPILPLVDMVSFYTYQPNVHGLWFHPEGKEAHVPVKNFYMTWIDN